MMITINQSIGAALLAAVVFCGLLGCQRVDDAQTAAAQSTDKSASSQSSQATELTGLTGCYAIEKGAPAQIWLHEQDGALVMQMKERADSGRAWDDPEPINVLTVAEGWRYFQTNALDIAASDIQAMAARPDGVFAIAKLPEASANTNPLLDSGYIVQLLGAVSTIYAVACDDTPVDLGKFHHGS